jgi:transcriptional regulator with XRE-family HTH domain
MQKPQEPVKQSSVRELSPEDSLFFRECVEFRKRAGITQRQVAEMMGTKESAIARLESLAGRSRGIFPGLMTLKRYAEALGCRLVLKLKPMEK